jgi:site-specific recombinase XerD
MLEHWGFALPAVLRRHRLGAFGTYIDAYAARLRDLGYVRSTARYHIQLIGAFGRWLKRRGLTIGHLDKRLIDRFISSQLESRRFRSGGRGTLRMLLRHLKEAGVETRPEPTPKTSLIDPVVQAYGEYLEKERQLAPPTLINYLPFVRRFLSERYGQAQPRLGELAAPDVTHFVSRHASKYSRGRAKLMVTALRSFFQFLRLRGEVSLDLAACVPTVPNWRLTGIPQALQAHEVDRLLNRCDRRTAVGRRNFAILQLLSRLGLRSGELVHLSLEDIDWEAGEIRVSGKTRRPNRLPLPREVGQALADYLTRGRPRCETRRVFVLAKAPYAGLAGGGTLASIVRRALIRAGLNPLHKGPHLLRHTLATRMLNRGASLSEIGEILRHRHPDTTAIYAKVDLVRLRTLARRWPGGAR